MVPQCIAWKCVRRSYHAGYDSKVTQEELDKLRKQVEKLIDTVLKGGLDGKLKAFLLEQLERIRLAIVNFRIHGVDGIVQALEKTLGVLHLRPDYRADLKQSEEGREFRDILKGVFQIATEGINHRAVAAYLGYEVDDPFSVKGLVESSKSEYESTDTGRVDEDRAMTWLSSRDNGRSTMAIIADINWIAEGVRVALGGLVGAGLVSLLMVIARDWVIERLKQGIKFEYDIKLEEKRAELKNESERLIQHVRSDLEQRMASYTAASSVLMIMHTASSTHRIESIEARMEGNS